MLDKWDGWVMMNQHQWVEGCLNYYKQHDIQIGDPNEGRWEDAHYPLPRSMGDSTVKLLHDHHQIQGVLQSEEVGRCCFYSGDVIRALRRLKLPQPIHNYISSLRINGTHTELQTPDFVPHLTVKVKEVRKEDTLPNHVVLVFSGYRRIFTHKTVK